LDFFNFFFSRGFINLNPQQLKERIPAKGWKARDPPRRAGPGAAVRWHCSIRDGGGGWHPAGARGSTQPAASGVRGEESSAVSQGELSPSPVWTGLFLLTQSA